MPVDPKTPPQDAQTLQRIVVDLTAQLDRTLKQARKGRIWPYVGDGDHPAVAYDYTATRERAGPEEFLKSYRGYLQADAYVA